MTENQTEHSHEAHNDDCVHCGLDYQFEMPEGLLEAADRNQVVIFAGAGISTEVPTVFPDTVLEIVASKLGITDPESFPATLQAYQDRFGRAALVRIIKRKFDYIDSFPRLRSDARKFHRELATMPYLNDLITTNWDTYFESECGATPFVTGEDIALWDMPGRRVLKVHGSIQTLASIVATEGDYEKRLADLGSNVMGALLRQLLATRTVVFIGYSLSDWNFERLYSALRADMADFAPRAYLVTPFDEGNENQEKFGLNVIKTSGVGFLKQLKAQMVGHSFIDDSVYEAIEDAYELLDEADEYAKLVSHKLFPAIIHCWAYHDGMRDALWRVRHKRSTGEYSDRHHVANLLRTYDALYERSYEAGRFTDAAYLDGYSNGLILLMSDDEEHGAELVDSVPLYFIYGADSAMQTTGDLDEALQLSRRRSPKTRKEARSIADHIPEGMVRSHAPFLPDFTVQQSEPSRV